MLFYHFGFINGGIDDGGGAGVLTKDIEVGGRGGGGHTGAGIDFNVTS